MTGRASTLGLPMLMGKEMIQGTKTLINLIIVRFCLHCRGWRMQMVEPLELVERQEEEVGRTERKGWLLSVPAEELQAGHQGS